MNNKRLGALVALWVVLAAVAVVWGLDRYESDIGARADAALAAGGLGDVDISVEGRDITVMAANGGRVDEIISTLEGIEGVRDVRADVEVLAAQVTTSTTAPPTTSTTTPPTSTTTTTSSTTTTTTTIPRPQARLVATLGPGSFALSGVVPDEDTAAQLLAAAEIAYAPFVQSDLIVSPEVDTPDWLERAPTGLALLPMITEGTITVEGDRIELAGQAPNPEFLALFESTVRGVFGLDDIVNEVEITNLASPDFRAAVSEGTLRLSGTIPSDGVRQIIVGGAQAAYGADAVVDELVVEDGLYTAFWVYTMPGVFQLLAPFPEYEFRVANGVTSGAIRSGASFAFGSAELTPELVGVLEIGAAILTRDFSLGTIVEGHTDSVGPAEFNQTLSEARAAAAVEYLISRGIAPERLKAVGFGEEQPAASNATPEGRRTNRRVEFVFGPVAEIVGSG
jgi:outer membrane protein OmpA-like peptidoglycan-associated protein